MLFGSKKRCSAISSTFNELILRQKKVGVYKIDKKEYISFATTQMYENYINKK